MTVRLLSIGALVVFSAWGQDAQQRAQEKQIDSRNKTGPGIVVSSPKVFDDYLLQQMLSAAEGKLARMQVLDEAAVGSKEGTVVGGRQTVNSLAVNAQGPAAPVVSRVSTGTGSPTVTTTTTPGVPASSAAPASASLPSSFGVSSSNILNEQMQLTYEIANLRLLLEGSLSDRLVNSTTQVMVKPRTTIGFSMALVPQYKKAVAVVEVEVSKAEDVGDPEPPAVTALLPREKTYNVAAIREKNVALGAGAATQVFGVSGSFLHGSKSYFMVQDQDTVALTLDLENGDKLKKTAFLWEFRPVLGQPYVMAGLKQTFVQLAFPARWDAPTFGSVTVRTYWREYDQKKGIPGNVIKGSLHTQYADFKIPNFKPAYAIEPDGFSVADLEDLGNGQMLVKLHQHFLPDTAVRIGSTILGEGPNGLTTTSQGIRFVASISDLANRGAALVARDGSETRLEIPHTIGTRTPRPPPEIVKVDVSTVDEANSLVSVQLKDPGSLSDRPQLVLMVGTRVYGYSDAPLLHPEIAEASGKMEVIVPTAWLIANPKVTVKPLFAPQRYLATYSLNLTPYGQIERVVLLEKIKDKSTFLLYGSRLEDAKILSPEGVALEAGPDKATLRRFALTADQMKGAKHILLQRGAERPILIPLPGGNSGDGSGGSDSQINVNATVDVNGLAPPPPPSIAAKSPVPVNADEATFAGPNLGNLRTVLFNGKPIPFTVADDGKTVVVKGLKANLVTAAVAAQLLAFIYDGVTVDTKLQVVKAN